jgi:putative membrane protein
MRNIIFATVIGTLLSSTAWSAGITPADRHMLNKLSQGSAAEVQLGQMVEKKASDPSVKQFAQKMVHDHSQLLAQTQSWAASHKVALSSTPGQEEKSMMNGLSGLSGQNFDHKYIEGMLDDHKKDVAEVAEYIDNHPHSSITPLLKQTLPILSDHLRIAENVAGRLGISPDAGLNQAQPQAAGSAGSG